MNIQLDNKHAIGYKKKGWTLQKNEPLLLDHYWAKYSFPLIWLCLKIVIWFCFKIVITA